MHILDLFMFFIFLGIIGKLFEHKIELGVVVAGIYTVLYVWIFVFPIDLNWVDIFNNITITW